ncbi:MAG: globin [Pseudomonadales bacterium]|nr:globin [Pseudomonadales bacterium]
MSNYEILFEASYDRVVGKGVGITEKGQRFFERFYENFFALSEEVQTKFRNTDMQVQVGMLEKSMYHLISFYVAKEASDYLRTMAEMHSKERHDISPGFYDLWMDALVQTVRELDPEFEDKIELAWRIAMTPGLLYMKFYYDKPLPTKTEPTVADSA